jgi:hypothetical protein
LANQGSSQGHRTATNTVESFIGYLDSDLTLHTITYEFISTLLGYCMENDREKYPQATMVLSQDFCMDDVVSGCDYVTEAQSYSLI